MKFGLSEPNITAISEVFRRFAAIDRAVLYGSRAKGTHRPGSDIDLTLFGKGLTPDMRAEIAGALDDLLLPYTIDLSIFDDLKHDELEEHIRHVGVVFYQSGSVVDD